MTAVLIRQSDGAQLTIDAVVDGEVQPTWEVTEHPIEVEDGSLATAVDHVRRRPTTVVLRCLWTERPTSQQADRGGPDRIREILAWLADAAGEPLTIALPHRPALRDMLLEGAPWEYRASEDLPARLSFREARFVSSLTVEAPARPKPGTAAAQATERDRGPTNTEREERRSILKIALQALGVYGGQ